MPTPIEDVYDSISDSFDDTRSRPWEFVVDHLKHFTSGQRILDAGCGNGRHAIACLEKGHEVVCSDISEGQLEMARKNCEKYISSGNIEFVKADLLELPFDDNSFDGVMAIAVIHHLKTRPERTKALQELTRVCKPGGKVLVSTWSMNHKRFEPRENGTIRGVEVVGPTDQDVTVAWSKDKDVPEKRFYHLYRSGELTDEAKDLKVELIEENEAFGNCIITLII